MATSKMSRLALGLEEVGPLPFAVCPPGPHPTVRCVFAWRAGLQDVGKGLGIRLKPSRKLGRSHRRSRCCCRCSVRPCRRRQWNPLQNKTQQPMLINVRRHKCIATDSGRTDEILKQKSWRTGRSGGSHCVGNRERG